MPDELEKAFCSYLNVVRSTLQNRPEQESRHLFLNKTIELQELVSKLEREPEFRHLVDETHASFLEIYHKKGEEEEETCDRCLQSVQNFFRRSGCYLDIFEGNPLGEGVTFQGYRGAFERREVTIRYFIPMEFVEFAETVMDFGTFQVQRFSVDELEGIFSNEV